MINRRICYLILLLLTTANIHLIGQNATIKGLITSENEALPFATVSIEESNIGKTADEEGFFEIENLNPGTYTLKASFVGYVPFEQELTLQAGEIKELNLQLKAGHRMEEVVVTGTMKPTFVSASPIKVEVVTAKQLDTYIPAASSSVVEGIQLVNGVQEVVACGVCYTNSISINGLQGAYTAVLMDGTPIYGNLASVYGLNGIPNMIIDRFEVIKGPSSTLYGSEAVAGVINIITKDPGKQPLLSVDIMGTSHLESFGNIAVAPKFGKTAGFIGLNYAYVNDFDDINNDGFGDGISLDRYSLFSKWNIHRKSGKQFTLAGKYFYEDRRNGVEEFLTDRNYRELRGSDSIYGESIYTHRAEFFGTYVFNTAPQLKLDFSFSDHQQDSYYGSDYYEARQKIAFSNLLWNTGGGKHDVLVGLTNRFQLYDDNTVATQVVSNTGEILNQADNQYIPGLFVQDEFTASQSWTLLGGARVDHYQAHGLIFSPRLSVKYKPSDWTTLRSNFGTGFRVVNLFTEDHAFITGQRTVEILESLDPERSYNASLSLNQIYTLGESSGTLDIETFYTYFNNKIIPDYDTPGKIRYANSNGYAQTMGIGATINHTFTFPFAFNVGFNLQDASQTELGDQGVNKTKAIEFSPRWSGVLTANYQWKKAKLTFAYTANFTGPMTLPEVYDLDENGIPLLDSRSRLSEPFSLHNLQITRNLNAKSTLYLGIQNLWNYRQTTSPLVGYNDPNASVGFSDFFDTSYAYAPNHGREFYLGIKWSL